MFYRILFSTLLVCTLSSAVMAEVPHQLHYSGFATDGAGDPLNCPNTFECATSFDLKFRIYSEGEGGAVYWEETHSAVSFYGGSFHVALGTVTPIDADLLSGDRWLGVAVNDNEEMFPRQKLLSAAYAIRAGTVENAENAAQLGGLSPADYASAESVTELQTIIDGSDDDTLAALGCATGQVAKASGGGWVCADAGDSDTQLTEEQVDEMVANNGYAVGPHTVDTDTQLTEEQVDEMVANNGYAVGPHTVDTDTQLTEEQVDAMTANNGYAQQDQVTGLGANLASLQTEVETAITTLTSLQGALSDLDAVVNTNGISIQVLQNNLTTAQEAISVTLSTVNDLCSDLSATENNVTNLQTAVTNLTNALTGVQGDLASHQANPDAHHSHLSDGLHIVPGSVTIKGTNTRLIAGELDLGSGADDQLTAPIVQTLTNGGDADSLHTHASAGGGGGSCYTAIGVGSCTTGYSLVYEGKMVQKSHVSSGYPGYGSPVCLALSAITEHPSGNNPSHLNFWGDGKWLNINKISCALCCP